MKTIYFNLLLIFLVLISFNSFSQTKAMVVLDELTETTEGVLIIKYHIENCKNNELFDISLLVKKGNTTITPINITGDIGKNTSGQGSKQIDWDLIQDKIILNESVVIQVIANAHEDFKQLKLSTLFLTSTILPGAGFKKIKSKW